MFIKQFNFVCVSYLQLTPIADRVSVFYRRNLNVNGDNTVAEKTTEQIDSSPPVLVEELVFSYEEIIGGDDDDSTTMKMTSTTEQSEPLPNKLAPITYLTPPSEGSAQINNF